MDSPLHLYVGCDCKATLPVTIHQTLVYFDIHGGPFGICSNFDQFSPVGPNQFSPVGPSVPGVPVFPGPSVPGVLVFLGPSVPGVPVFLGPCVAGVLVYLGS